MLILLPGKRDNLLKLKRNFLKSFQAASQSTPRTKKVMTGHLFQETSILSINIKICFSEIENPSKQKRKEIEELTSNVQSYMIEFLLSVISNKSVSIIAMTQQLTKVLF